MTPDGAHWAPRPRVDNAMVKALARAFRWRKMLDDGVHSTLEDLARAKGVNATYVSRLLQLTQLAPDIVEAILDGRRPAELQLDDLLEGFRWSGRGNARCFSAAEVERVRGPNTAALPESRRSPAGYDRFRLVAEPSLAVARVDLRTAIPGRPWRVVDTLALSVYVALDRAPLTRDASAARSQRSAR